jgi:hypothetical protein
MQVNLSMKLRKKSKKIRNISLFKGVFYGLIQYNVRRLISCIPLSYRLSKSGEPALIAGVELQRLNI